MRELITNIERIREEGILSEFETTPVLEYILEYKECKTFGDGALYLLSPYVMINDRPSVFVLCVHIRSYMSHHPLCAQCEMLFKSVALEFGNRLRYLAVIICLHRVKLIMVSRTLNHSF